MELATKKGVVFIDGPVPARRGIGMKNKKIDMRNELRNFSTSQTQLKRQKRLEFEAAGVKNQEDLEKSLGVVRWSKRKIKRECPQERMEKLLEQAKTPMFQPLPVTEI